MVKKFSALKGRGKQLNLNFKTGNGKAKEIQKWKVKKRKITAEVLGTEKSPRNKIYANTKYLSLHLLSSQTVHVESKTQLVACIMYSLSLYIPVRLKPLAYSKAQRSIFVFSFSDFVCNYQLHTENSEVACPYCELHKKMQLLL